MKIIHIHIRAISAVAGDTCIFCSGGENGSFFGLVIEGGKEIFSWEILSFIWASIFSGGEMLPVAVPKVFWGFFSEGELVLDVSTRTPSGFCRVGTWLMAMGIWINGQRLTSIGTLPCVRCNTWTGSYWYQSAGIVNLYIEMDGTESEVCNLHYFFSAIWKSLEHHIQSKSIGRLRNYEKLYGLGKCWLKLFYCYVNFDTSSSPGHLPCTLSSAVKLLPVIMGSNSTAATEPFY